MRLANRSLLHDFAAQQSDAKKQLDAWEDNVKGARWHTPHELKQSYPKADFPGNQNVIFDICWNRYRLWVKVNYETGTVFVKNIGTHKEYNKWDIR